MDYCRNTNSEKCKILKIKVKNSSCPFWYSFLLNVNIWNSLKFSKKIYFSSKFGFYFLKSLFGSLYYYFYKLFLLYRNEIDKKINRIFLSLCFAYDFWTDMVILYSKALYRSLEVLTLFLEGDTIQNSSYIKTTQKFLYF